MGIERWLDLILLIIVLGFGVIVLNVCAVEYSNPLSTKVEDKTVVKTEEELLIDDSIKTGKDLLMSLVVVDEFVSYPRAIKINDTPVIQFTDSWIVSKNQNIAQIYSATGEYRLGLMLDWKIESVRYVYENNGSGYLWYKLTQ